MANRELTEDELSYIVLISAMPMIVLGVSAFFLYLLPQRESALIEGFIKSVSYFILLFLPAGFAAFALTFEVLYHIKIKKPFVFHLKRFLSRMTLAVGFTLLLVAVTNVLYMLLHPLFSLDHILTISLLTASFILFILVLKFRVFFGKLDKGNW